MAEVVDKTTVTLTQEEVEQAIVEFVGGLHLGELPPMNPETIVWQAYAGDPNTRYHVKGVVVQISSDS